jgi:hypothetical protein
MYFVHNTQIYEVFVKNRFVCDKIHFVQLFSLVEYPGPIFVEANDQRLADTREIAELKKQKLSLSSCHFGVDDVCYIIMSPKTVSSFTIKRTMEFPGYVIYDAVSHVTQLFVQIKSVDYLMFRTEKEAKAHLVKHDKHLEHYTLNETSSIGTPAENILGPGFCFYDLEENYVRYSQVVQVMPWRNDPSKCSYLCCDDSNQHYMIKCTAKRYTTLNDALNHMQEHIQSDQVKLNVLQPFYMYVAGSVMQFFVEEVYDQGIRLQYKSFNALNCEISYNFFSDQKDIFKTSLEAVCSHHVKMQEQTFLSNFLTDLDCHEIMVDYSHDVAG